MRDTLWNFYRPCLPGFEEKERHDLPLVWDELGLRLFELAKIMFQIGAGHRQVTLSQSGRQAYEALVFDSASQQAEMQYESQYGVSVFGKLPEQALRMALVFWAVDWIRRAAHAELVPGRGPALGASDITRAVEFLTLSLDVELAFMDVSAGGVPRGLIERREPVRSAGGPGRAIGYGPDGRQLQTSWKHDRDIVFSTFCCPGMHISWRVIQGWKAPRGGHEAAGAAGEQRRGRFPKNAWELVLAHVGETWPTLGRLEQQKSRDTRFAFQPVPEDPASPDFAGHVEALAACCGMSMAAFLFAGKQVRRPSEGRRDDGAAGITVVVPRTGIPRDLPSKLPNPF